MSNDLFGAAIGRALVSENGLVAAYLPERIKQGIVESIVRRANDLVAVDPPYAILVSSGAENLTDRSCLIISPDTAIQYRQGQRLAVVFGKHPEIQSFVQAFRQVVEQDFPAGENSILSMEKLAKSALEEVLLESDIAFIKGSGRDLSVERLANCFSLLQDAHKELGQGSDSWNVYWFHHISEGLSNLSKALRDLKVRDPAIAIEDALKRLTFASFSLPLPNHDPLYGAARNGKALSEAILEFWSDKERIVMIVDRLSTHPDTLEVPHALSKIDWRDFGRTLASLDNPLIAWASHDAKNPDRVQAYVELTERQFFNPLSLRKDNQSLQIENMDGLSLSIFGGIGPYMVAGLTGGGGDTNLNVFSEPVAISVPFLEEGHGWKLEDGVVTQSGASLKTSDPNVTWDGTLETIGGEGLQFVGHFTRIEGSAQTVVDVKEISLNLVIPNGDSLEGIIAYQANTTFFFAPAIGPGGLVFKKKKGGNKLIGAFSPDTCLSDGTEVPLPGSAEPPVAEDLIEVELGAEYFVHIWRASVVSFNGEAQAPRAGLPNNWLIYFKATALSRLLADNMEIEFVPLSTNPECFSPVLAAMTKSPISTGALRDSTVRSIRGRIEQLLTTNVLTGDWSEALGHLVLSSDRDATLESSRALGSTGFLSPVETAENWLNNQPHFSVPEAVRESPEASEFRAAFEKVLTRGLADDGSEAKWGEMWPSRTSWKHLWVERSALADYLKAYANLVEYARSNGDPAGIFWASYPLSASVWGDSGSGCKAVLLSPLHPLRLAWLSAVEWVMSDAEDASQLGGTVEGWNLPLLGPRNSQAGRMLAVPQENGEGEVFLGWSMLVKADIDDPAALDLPTKIAGMPSPGASSSGLNAAAVEAAIRDYQRINPHISTLTIDLATSRKVVRLDEIDEAVLAATELWTNGARGSSKQVRGGIRVLDSLDRLGESPRDKVADLVTRAQSVPISWSRYRPGEATQSCNLRLLQDSGIRVRVHNGDEADQGLVGPVPIRRFDSMPPRILNGCAESSPALTPGQGWEPYVHALRQIEGADSHPVVSAQLFRALLIDERADWTVSGETLMSPSAMAKLIAANGDAGQMLWEWRPPFLDSESRSKGLNQLLERRPFVSVVRVPGGFRSGLKEKLSKVQGVEASEGAVSTLLNDLGARGVGLSSLTSMGGTHTAGALGFYLAMRLMDKAKLEGVDQIVLPIDSCDSFLKALGGGPSSDQFRERADLLVARIFDETIVLTPIEIKFYGLVAAVPAVVLPSTEDHTLRKATEQLGSTMTMLRRVEERSAKVSERPDSGDARLWTNGLLTLIDAGIRLSNPDAQFSSLLPERLRKVAEGTTRVVVGKPVICYFGHGAFTSTGGSHSIDLDIRLASGYPDPIAALIANPGEVIKDLSIEGSPILGAWNQIMNWACARPAVEEIKPTDEANSNSTVVATLGKGNPERTTETVAAPTQREGVKEESLPEEGSADGIRFPVGKFIDALGQAEAEYWPSNTALNQMNIGVVGDLGTGKTQLLKSLMLSLRRKAIDGQPSPLSILVFDYKADYQDQEFLAAVGGRVLLPSNIPLNVFSLSEEYTPLAAYNKAASFIDVLKKIYGGIGPVQENKLATVITNLFSEGGGDPPTLAAVLHRYREEVGVDDAVVAVINPFVIGQVFSDKPADLKPFEALLDDSVLVVGLHALGANQKMKNAIVVLFLNQYFEYMLRQKKWPFEKNAEDVGLRRLNSFLLVDEATNIMQYQFPVLMNLMLQGREFGTGVVLASQFLSHFKVGPTNYGQPLLTWFIHKVPAVTKQELVTLGIVAANENMASKIPTLELHQALYVSLGVQGRFIRGKPFYEHLGNI